MMLTQETSLAQTQRLKLTPQLYQSLKLMRLPLQALRFQIQRELERNPALEIVSDSATVSLESLRLNGQEKYSPFENSSDPGYVRRYDQEASDRKQRFIESALTRSESLQEHLLWQLRLQPIPPELSTIGELLIQNLDANGFHREDPSQLVPADRHDDLRRMMRMIQVFDPVGVCVSDYKESLLVQISVAESAPPEAITIITDYLDLLEHKRYVDIARKMKIDESRIWLARRFIRSLDPFPGRRYSAEQTNYVVPDLQIEQHEGEFIIRLNEEEIPVLGVNEFYHAMSDNATTKQSEASRFAHKSVRDAHWFIGSIRRRNETLLKTAMVIVTLQRDFFLNGPTHLAPLTLQDVASEIGIHETTVSRITTAKYVQTDWGLYELKYFFSIAIPSDAHQGGEISREAVKATIGEILEEESQGDSRLSDREISDRLKSRGITVARRTVAKYRTELRIDSSYARTEKKE